MKRLVEEYGAIIVVVVLVLLILLFGIRFAKKTQEAILGSTNHIVETVENITKKKTGDVLEIGGQKYIVISKKDKDTYLVISENSIGNMQYQPNQDSNGNYYDVGKYNENDLQDKRYDGQNSNVYEDSYIDKYLESTYYNSLPEELKKAIVITSVKQEAYYYAKKNDKWNYLTETSTPVSPDGTRNYFYNKGTASNPKYIRWDKVVVPDDESGAAPIKYWTKKKIGYEGQTYNTITRHVYLPSVEEISNLVDLNNANKSCAFFKRIINNSSHQAWLRDACSASPNLVVTMNGSAHSLDGYQKVSTPWYGVVPAFVIDLSKVDYTKVGHVDYK